MTKPIAPHTVFSAAPGGSALDRLRRGILAGAALCAAVALAACGEEPDSESQFDYRAWDQYLGGPGSTQYSALDQIDETNVDQLEVAWTYEIGEGQSPRFNPIVVDGVMYVWAKDSALVALDARTGEEIWTHPNDGRIGNRGINHWESEDGSEKRLLYILNGALTAIDADTGETITSFGEDGRVPLRDALDWPRKEEDIVRGLQTDNPGRIYEDLIIISLPAGGARYNSTPGDIQAYNVRTGELEWTFHSVPRQGEFGAETWPKEAVGEVGGVHNWSESTLDPERGIIFIPFGTARYDFYGGNRHGNNLFGNSIVALDARTGERIWHFQTIHHDLWDLDLPAAPKLLTVEHEGETVPAVAQPSKHGYLFVFNRETGEPLWPIEEQPVPASDVPGEEASPTQPIPTKPEPYGQMSFTAEKINPYLPEEDQAALRKGLKKWRNEGLFTPPSLEGTITMPGHNGGANWGTSAVDPVNGRMYVSVRNIPVLIKLRKPDPDRDAPPVPATGEDFVPYYAPVDFMVQSNGMVAIEPPWSELAAYDLNTGEKLWEVPHGGVTALIEKGITDTGSHWPRGGLAVTGGGLIFAGTSSDKSFRAYDAEDGSVLWETKVPAAIEGVPAVYEVDGRQYVAVAMGGNGIFALPSAKEPGPNQYMVFALPEE